MPKPQTAIIPEPGPYALFLVLKVKRPAKDGRPILGEIARRLEQLTPEDRAARLLGSVAIGYDFWKKAGLGNRPKYLRPFRPIGSGKRKAPATHGDLLVHLVSKRHDLNFRLASEIVAGGRISVMTEIHGFRYLDARDLTGFIDGTENPKGSRERSEAALVGDEDPHFSGGSYVFTQKYIHNLEAWGKLSQKAQERIIGRTKPASIELKGKPATAHISRVVIEENGEELEIVRHSFPYGTTTEAGLFFIAYTKNPSIPEKMLSRMMGVSGDGQHDHLMDFTRPDTGGNFFAPSLNWLHSHV